MLYPKSALAKVLLDKPELLKEVCQALDRISDEVLMGEGRVYGAFAEKILEQGLTQLAYYSLPALRLCIQEVGETSKGRREQGGRKYKFF